MQAEYPACASAPLLVHDVIRTQAYDLPVEVGLVRFGSNVNLDCAITPLLENFRDQAE